MLQSQEFFCTYCIHSLVKSAMKCVYMQISSDVYLEETCQTIPKLLNHTLPSIRKKKGKLPDSLEYQKVQI